MIATGKTNRTDSTAATRALTVQRQEAAAGGAVLRTTIRRWNTDPSLYHQMIKKKETDFLKAMKPKYNWQTSKSTVNARLQSRVPPEETFVFVIGDENIGEEYWDSLELAEAVRRTIETRMEGRREESVRRAIETAIRERREDEVDGYPEILGGAVVRMVRSIWERRSLWIRAWWV